MKVMIPSAGFGTRLRPHTWSKPKPLAPVDPAEFIFVYGWLGEQIEGHVRAAYPRIRGRYIEQTELKGQAHALWLARTRGVSLVSVFADTLFRADLLAVRDLNADGAAFVKEVDDPRRFGVAELDARGDITRLIEKPTSLGNKLVMIGLYHSRQAERLFEAIQGLMDRDRPSPAPPPGVAIIPPVSIAPDATIERAVIGPHVSIGAGAVVCDAIIDEAGVVERALVEHSLIGPRCPPTPRRSATWPVL